MQVGKGRKREPCCSWGVSVRNDREREGTSAKCRILCSYMSVFCRERALTATAVKKRNGTKAARGDADTVLHAWEAETEVSICIVPSYKTQFCMWSTNKNTTAFCFLFVNNIFAIGQLPLWHGAPRRALRKTGWFPKECSSGLKEGQIPIFHFGCTDMSRSPNNCYFRKSEAFIQNSSLRME